MAKLLITGAGGPPAIAFMQSLPRERHAFIAADMDPCAAGFFVDGVRARCLLPRGDDPEYIDALLAACRTHWIDVLVPTVRAELLPIARARHRFTAQNIAVVLPPRTALETCLDSLALDDALQGTVPTPDLQVLTAQTRARGRWVARPRTRGDRATEVIPAAELLQPPPDMLQGRWLLQAWLDGPELAVDVYVDRGGRCLAAVPREEMTVRSGVALASRTVVDPDLQRTATLAAQCVGLRGIATVRIRRDAQGVGRVFAINPRVPGEIQLTVAAGVRMPEMAVREALGETLRAPPDFREIAMVRTLAATFVDPATLAQTGLTMIPA